MIYAGRLRLEVQTRALSYTIVDRTLPFMYTFHSTRYSFHIPTVRFYRPYKNYAGIFLSPKKVYQKIPTLKTLRILH